MGETGFKFESWNVKNYTQNASPYHVIVFWKKSESWNSGCSQKIPTHVKRFWSKTQRQTDRDRETDKAQRASERERERSALIHLLEYVSLTVNVRVNSDEARGGVDLEDIGGLVDEVRHPPVRSSVRVRCWHLQAQHRSVLASTYSTLVSPLHGGH